MIGQLHGEAPVELLCSVFEVTCSCYYAYRRKRRSPDVARLALRVRVNELFTQSRGAAGSRSIRCLLHEEGIRIVRFKVRTLMSEMGLFSKQPGSPPYKRATVERPDIPNVLDRGFDVSAPNQMWYGDITYVWAQGKWYYVDAIIDPFARHVVDRVFSVSPIPNWSSRHLTLRTRSAASPERYFFKAIRVADTPAVAFFSGSGATA